MKDLLTAVIAIFCVALFSCKKDTGSRPANRNYIDTSRKGNLNGTQLIRIITRIGTTDSSIANFYYNSSNRLTLVSDSGSYSGNPYGTVVSILRNESNIIRMVGVMGMPGSFLDCVYDKANSRYAYLIKNYSLDLPMRDSIVLNYSVGKIVSSLTYTLQGFGYQLVSKDSVTYNGNNVASENVYNFDGSNFNLDVETKYEQYDSAANPLNFADEAFILGECLPGFFSNYAEYYSVNNVIKYSLTDYTSAFTKGDTFSDSYNINNRPSKGIITEGTKISTSTYYYQ